MKSVMQLGAGFYIWHADSEGFSFRKALKAAGFKVRQCLVWVKNSIVLGRQDYQWKHEPCLYGWNEGAAHYFTDERTHATVYDDKVDIAKLNKAQMAEMLKKILSEKIPTTILREDKPLRNGEHPTMKPVALIGKIMSNSSKTGWGVLDTFGGSGTTLIAAEQLGRKCYMMELDPHYCDVIIARWEKLTGKTAIKIS